MAFKLSRQNLPIVIGVSLPVLVVVFFALATLLPQWLVDPPQHDLVYTASRSYSPDGPPLRLSISVSSEGRLVVRAYPTENNYREIPRLMLFDHTSQSVREIPLDLPAKVENLEDGHEIALPEWLDRKISTDRRAPDGYEYRGAEYSGGGPMGIFYRGRHHGPAVHKSGRTIRMQTDDASYYGVNFLGWVVDGGAP